MAPVASAVLWTEMVGFQFAKQGVAQVEVEGLVVTAFDHRDSRAGDPDLHTHFVGHAWGGMLAFDGRAGFRC
ncbi:relaxase domain-containing protein [Nocardia sp. GP40]|uniref:relaxase domain-containing protein n=1 Tax=Nocardia sp. GP40 TaxID=3156268 RepID=UPI003D1C5465